MAAHSLTENEIEFLAEQTSVEITPNFTSDELMLVTGEYGPFMPNLPICVPLWMALHLKRAKQCRIRPPPWLSLDVLNEKIEAEKNDAELFVNMPPHYLEVATTLFNHAADDLPSVTKLKSALATLETLRAVKLRNGLAGIRPGFAFAKLNNLTLMEINKIRSYTTIAVDQFYRLSDEAADAGDSQSQSQSQAAASSSSVAFS